MLADGLSLINNSTAANFSIESGSVFPADPSAAQLFYKTTTPVGLYIYDGAVWTLVGTSEDGGGGSSYTAGSGIDITNGVISTTVKSDGTGPTALYVQAGDGQGGFVGINQPATEGLVLTSHTTGLPTWEPAQTSGGTVTSVNVLGGTTGLSFSGGPITTEGDITMSGTLGIANGGTGATTVSGVIANILPSQAGHAGAALVTDGLGNVNWEILPGTAYVAGAGIQINSNQIVAIVANNSGEAHRVQVSNGDGTVRNLSAGEAGRVLTSAGDGVPPTWENISGTVSQINIVRNPDMGLRITGGAAKNPPVANTTEITTTGTIGLAGVLTVEYGGTGVTTDQALLDKIFPSYAGNEKKFLSSNGVDNVVFRDPFPDQTGNSGKFLTTDGNDLAWGVPAGGGTVTSVSVSGGTTGLSFSGGPVTVSGTMTLGGVLGVSNGGTGGLLPVSHGGTGASTAADAINALVPSQTGQAGKILTTDGTTVSWTTSSAGSVQSVDIDPSTTGLTFSGGPITSNGTFVVGGTLAIANGGTGASTANGALNALLPLQAGNGGKVLSTDGSSTSWVSFADNLFPSQTGNGGKFLTTDGTVVSWADQTLELPPQTGNAGKYLTTDGTTASWETVVGGGGGSVSSVNASGGTTGLTFSGGPITSSGTLTLGGTLAIANGGTGASTAADAINALVPSQTGNASRVLTTDGSVVSWQPVGGGTVTSVSASGGVTGLTFTGSPITSSGTLTLGGTLAIANGGTGATSAQAARNNLLPTQTSKAGYILVTDGTNADWTNPASLGNIAAGSTGQIQYNNNGALAASASLVFTPGTGNLAATSFTGSGASLTALNGSNISTGTIAPARLGSGTPTSATYLRGDGVWSSSVQFAAASPTYAASQTLDLSTGSAFSITLTGNITTLAFTNVPASGTLYEAMLFLKQDATGSRTVNWPTSFKWSGGAAPVLTTSGSKTDIIFIVTVDGGTTWFASVVGLNY